MYKIKYLREFNQLSNNYWYGKFLAQPYMNMDYTNTIEGTGSILYDENVRLHYDQELPARLIIFQSKGLNSTLS